MNRIRLRLIVFSWLSICLWGLFTLPLAGLDPEKTITQYSVQVWNMESGLPGNSVFAITRTRDGYLWLGTQDGLVRFDGFDFELYTRETVSGLTDNVIRAVYEDSEGALWIGAASGGLTRYYEGVFREYTVARRPAPARIRAISEDRRGNLWIGSLSGGLTCFNGDSATTYSTAHGLPGSQVRGLYKDGTGDLWATTTSGIVKILEPGDFRVYARHNELPHSKTVSLYDTDTGTLWIGTGGGGLFRLKNGVYKAYGAAEGLPHRIVTQLAMDRMKNLWIGTDGGGLTRMNNGVFSTLPGGDGLDDGFVYSIYEDPENSLWVGTVHGGLHQLRDNKFTTFTTREGLVHDYTNCVYPDRAGDLFIGANGGVNRLSRGVLTTEYAVGQGPLRNPVTCLWEEPGGALWIGAWGGLHRVDDGKISSFTTRDGMSDLRIRCIAGDSRGNLWIGTQKGLNRFDKDRRVFHSFTVGEGPAADRVTFVFEDHRDSLWIGTADGLKLFRDGAVIAPPDPGLEGHLFRCVLQDNKGVLWFGAADGLIRWDGVRCSRLTTRDGLVGNNIMTIMEDDAGYLWLGGSNGISRINKNELTELVHGENDRVHPDWYNENDGMKSRWCTGAGRRTRDGRFWFPTSVGVTMIDPENFTQTSPPPPPIIEKFIVDGETIPIHDGTKQKKTLELEPGKKRLEVYYTGVSFINPKKVIFKLKLTGYDRDWVEAGNRRSTIYTGLSPGRYTFSVTAGYPGAWSQKNASFSFYLKPYFYQTPWFYLLVTFAVLFAIFSFFRFRVRQLRAREKKLSLLVDERTRDLKERNSQLRNAHRSLSTSNEIIGKKNRNIMDSMRYAGKIQQAMLPVAAKMEKALTDYFIISRPKDIVSGDFYWFETIGGHYFLAVADCTGHGVPGALLSMIGSMMLNEAIKDKRIFDPGMALSHLNRGFRSTLKQEAEDADSFDGMDVALCRIDPGEGKLVFAGACRPLYYVAHGELVEIKGRRKPIGGRQKEERRLFDSREIDIPDNGGEGIMVYLTSDGFADQQDARDQKYGSPRLKAFLRSHAHLSLAHQEEALLAEFEKHKGGVEQRDDVTVIGVRIRGRFSSADRRKTDRKKG